MKRIAFLAGARPNYMKVFPVWKALTQAKLPVETLLIHTGQHYDELMSEVFFRDFEMEKPTYFLGVGSGSHGEQTARAMVALEQLLQQQPVDLLVVPGDVNSTLAGALVAVKMGVAVAHLEAGLRSFDRSMPEEINRIVTDAISTLCLTSCREADVQLRKEGIPPESIRFVGNVMIDSLCLLLPKAGAAGTSAAAQTAGRPFVLVTLHRPSNVDDVERLRLLMSQLTELANEIPIVFPVHPRTRKQLASCRFESQSSRLCLSQPLGYLDFLALEARAALVVTDSGGVQEETSYLGIPCLTVRPNTERPVTVSEGTNRLLDPTSEPLAKAARAALQQGRRHSPCPIDGWDGRAAQRIVLALREILKL